ncbi:MFS transporter [Ornithinicoccus hortensis]|uniref:Putative MFS family arabinose efflux permease n=1 Tax=Ornithinicoccus hortensis TaxID=82346 RepID=A0A542YM79_9MICO|nr:MFS transporter [Ornithinicoccus hortensis]TQL49199.1 putative MFS family arabinose efflux permease [Ornithinicoccus hortensis]
MTDQPPPTRPPGPVAAASFASSFDRFAVSPLLVLVATDLGATLAQALAVASAYFLAYGVSQPLWGVLSDRFGRVRLMRTALVGAALAGLLSALAPTLGLLVAARALTGAAFGAVVPTSLTYVGDTVDEEHRQPALSDLMAAMAVGTALATAVAGLLGDLAGWRTVFALPAVFALGCSAALRSVPEPHREPGGGALRTMLESVRHRWVLVVLLLALAEGAITLGVLTLLAPSLQAQGASAGTAGLATAAYGASVVLTTRLVRVLTRRIPMTGLMAVGGSAVAIGYAVLAVRVSVPTVLVAAALIGVSWAFLHTSLQTWATVVLPHARGTVVSLFAASLFAGSSLGTWAAGPWSQHDRWALLFGVAAASAALLTLVSVGARRTYPAPAARSAR